jgi:putative transposase
MPNTYGDIYVQVVFAVKYRRKLIDKSWKDELNKYITGIINRKGVKPLIVNGVSDHIHIFFSMKSHIVIADLVRDIKRSSTNFINDNKFLNCKFEWQTGYGFFSYSKKHVSNVYNYILNQEAHHHKNSFEQEYVELLKINEVEYEEKYLFDPFES